METFYDEHKIEVNIEIHVLWTPRIYIQGFCKSAMYFHRQHINSDVKDVKRSLLRNLGHEPRPLHPNKT